MQDLLAYLSGSPAEGRYQQWHIQRIGGGVNNLLYRASGDEGDVAVKFTLRDERRRASREYHALLALQTAGLDVAPRPLWLDEHTYPQPVVVQTWLEGEVTADPPWTDKEWLALVDHYAAVHTVTPAPEYKRIQPAVQNFASVTAAYEQIRQQLAHIPTSHQPLSLTRLIARLGETPSALVGAPSPVALCRVDPNTLNFIRRPGQWASVDWENSGWGDPAFEMVDVMTHPRYEQAPATRWQWLIRLYAERTGDETAVDRINSYYPLMLIWWAARLARMLYEVPRGLDERLVQRPSNWQTTTEASYERYIALATAIY